MEQSDATQIAAKAEDKSRDAITAKVEKVERHFLQKKFLIFLLVKQCTSYRAYCNYCILVISVIK